MIAGAGHGRVDRLVDGPAAFAGVLDDASDLLEDRVGLEGPVEELEQPAPHDGAVLPEGGDLREVELEGLGGVHELETLGVGLHEAVLDPVVHHLHEVPGAGRADVRIAALRSKCCEDGLQGLVRGCFRADHDAVALSKAPDPTGDAHIDELNTLRLCLLGMAHRVPKVRVATVDEDVSVLEQRQQSLKHHLRGLAGGDHQPDDPRLLESRGELDQGVGGALRRCARVRLHLVAARAEALRHVAAHAAEADDSELHRSSSLTRTIGRLRSRRAARSPTAWQWMRRRNPNSRPGMGSSSPGSSTTCTKRPVGGPPLWSWPVE